MAESKTVTKIINLITPVIKQQNLTLWDVRFEKEGSSYFLRIFIDKEGGLDMDSCEEFTREINKIIDDADPIEQSYYLEVSSPGLERELKKNEHFQSYINQKISLKLIRPSENGMREFVGTLRAYENNTVTIETDSGTFDFPKNAVAYAKTFFDFG